MRRQMGAALDEPRAKTGRASCDLGAHTSLTTGECRMPVNVPLGESLSGPAAIAAVRATRAVAPMAGSLGNFHSLSSR